VIRKATMAAQDRPFPARDEENMDNETYAQPTPHRGCGDPGVAGIAGFGAGIERAEVAAEIMERLRQHATVNGN